MIKIKKKLVIIGIVVSSLTIAIITIFSKNNYSYIPDGEVNVFLYGETHDKKEIIKKEYELWEQYYNDFGIRHLFYEAFIYRRRIFYC